MGTYETETVWFAQHRARDFRGSVWEPAFLSAMIRVIRNGLWKEFPHEAWGRSCRFDEIKAFLTSEDGLGLPDIKACCTTIRSVAESPVATTIRKDATTTLQDLAKQLLVELEAAGVTELAAQVDEAKEAPLLPHGDTDSKARSDSGQFAKAEGEQPSSGRQGTSKEYLLRRIARDHPEMLDDIGSGKTYRSARAAAIAAGIIHDVPTVRLTDPDKVGDQLLERMGPEWAAQLASSLTSKLPAPKDDQVVNRPAPGRGGVSINIGPASPDDRLRDYLPQRWPAILRERRYFLETKPAYIGRALAMYLEEAEQYHAEMGYSSAAELLRKELGVKPEWMQKAIEVMKSKEKLPWSW